MAKKKNTKKNTVKTRNISSSSAEASLETTSQPGGADSPKTGGNEHHSEIAAKAAKRTGTMGLVLKVGIPLLLLGVIFYLFFGTGIGSSMNRAKMKEYNVILITLDTLRADFVSAYKPGRAETPNLDRLAKEGVLFEHCISQTPLTLPAHVSILSGTYPLHHQVRDNGGFLVPETLEFISEPLQAKGYATSAFIAAYVLHSKWGLNQGFDFYSDEFDMTKYKQILLQNEKTCDVVLADAQTWLKQNKNKKFFSWIHLYDPHTPYSPPEAFAKKNPGKPYKGEVEFLDDELGKFFAFLRSEGLDKNTLVIVTADHGESLGQFGEPEHGLFVYEPTVWVPLIIRAPFSFPVKRVAETVEHVDLAPTVMDALGITMPASYQGNSLLSLMFDTGKWDKKNAYTETYYPRMHFGWSELKGFYKDKLKYIDAPKEELYDLNADPEEKENLALKKSFDKQKLKEKSDAFTALHTQNALTPGKNKNMNADDVKRLQALGYVTSTVDTTGKTNLPDPKDKTAFYGDFLRASDLLRRGKKVQAIALLHSLLNREPTSSDAHNLLGSIYMESGNYEDAIKRFKMVLELKPMDTFIMMNILACYDKSGRYADGVRDGETFLKTFPEDTDIMVALGNLYFKNYDYDNALKYLEKAVAVIPNNQAAWVRIGEVNIMKRDPDAAAAALDKALAVKAGPRVNFLLGQVEDMRGNMKKANQYYLVEIKVNPDGYEAPFSLASNLLKIGAGDRALKYFRMTIRNNPHYNMPYFLIAQHFLKTGSNLSEAVDLCKIGLALTPYDQGTMFGYFVITNIFARIGDNANFNLYTKKGEELYNKLQEAGKAKK